MYESPDARSRFFQRELPEGIERAMRKNAILIVAMMLVLNLTMSATAQDPNAVPPAPDSDTGDLDSEGVTYVIIAEEPSTSVPEETSQNAEPVPVAPGRPFYSWNGVYSRIILFDRYRETPNESLPNYSTTGKYANEVIHDDPDMLREDQERNPNMWPWRAWYSESNWSVPFDHDQSYVSHSVESLPHFEINWKSFEPYQLTDLAMRKSKAEEVNRMLMEDPELNRDGVDWKEHPWPQLHDLSLRLHYAKRLKGMGVKVDYRRYSHEQLLNFATRVKLAQELDKLGCQVNWRLYSWRQLNNLLKRAERSDKLIEKNPEV